MTRFVEGRGGMSLMSRSTLICAHESFYAFVLTHGPEVFDFKWNCSFRRKKGIDILPIVQLYPCDATLVLDMNGNLFWSDVMKLDMVRAHKVAGLGPKDQSSFSWVCIAFDWVDRHCVGQDTAVKMNTNYPPLKYLGTQANPQTILKVHQSLDY